ncbi:2-(3-amino-3-carboxypropyl)histidine synthase subunit 2-like [Agrilus planipennis]|uniref:2-(3-amino-3-carboxypropyl)histidine synthase subunit 2-like n=1 Tax=Agrilus planipennis TaxID=224129 RepID=A0A1W4XPP6_AGRPL|nr:2-(3-amino-3-carboxypropyl)histidine synthase subunit 2-like [Agrilus planipennis]XP_018334370.1 2-(3-amino-3-carboxypropyl)histidine synthase subunit 2-like [Agrilus planipennis]
MAAFFSNEAVSLDKTVNTSSVLTTKSDEIESVYDIEKCTNWIKENNFKNVCLQFPDFLLPDSVQISILLESLLGGQRVYIMADTAYESCCIDYLTAAHVDGDAIIHFGPICFSKESGKVPCLKVFEKGKLNVDGFVNAFGSFDNQNNEEVIILMDTPYLNYLEELRTNLSTFKNVSVRDVTDSSLSLGLQCTIFVSNNLRKVNILSQRYSEAKLYHCNPENESPLEILNFQQDLRVIKRRNFLYEKIKDSKTLGIIIGTLAIKNYLSVIDRVKKLLKLNNKKYYLISVGRPTVAKLANFPEIEVYILVSCSMNELYESRDFYQPIVTPYDVEMALNPNAKQLQFSYDFNTYFSETDLENLNLRKANEDADVSLITGKVRQSVTQEEDSVDLEEQTQVALGSDGTVALNTHYGAGFLGARSWKGLDPNLGKDEPAVIQEGRKGVAMAYENEQT